jgi:hypothetical protein
LRNTLYQVSFFNLKTNIQPILLSANHWIFISIIKITLAKYSV